MQEYGIQGFPTIKVFVPGKPPVDYQGQREVKPIAEFALQQVCYSSSLVQKESINSFLILLWTYGITISFSNR